MTATSVLDEADWQERERTHRARIHRWTQPYRQRKARGEQHPVLDFLFTYYSHRPAHLERWQPGPWVALAGSSAHRFLDRSGYRKGDDGHVRLDFAAFGPKRARTAEFVRNLLSATAGRAPRLSCFGLHEWAMVYQQSPEHIRHAGVPLRLGPEGTDAVVESLEIRCSHYDAFRFFTEPARPRNVVTPTRRSQTDLEQPGCLHANMDLYKWAYKLDPFVPSELIAECFELTADIRELDMRASPYDLSGHGYPPVTIETSGGRAEYARAQAAFVRRAEPLRQRLVELCDRLLAETSVAP